MVKKALLSTLTATILCVTVVGLHSVSQISESSLGDDMATLITNEKMVVEAPTYNSLLASMSYGLDGSRKKEKGSTAHKVGVDMKGYLKTPFNAAYSVVRSKDNMLWVPGGNIEMNSGIDPIWGDSIPTKLVSISPFWLDETEVTNKQYREFVFYVRDSIVRSRLADPELGGDPQFKLYEFDPVTGDIVSERINWNKKIPWKKPKELEAAAIVSVLSGAPFTEGLQIEALNYKYDWFDNKTYLSALIEMKRNNIPQVTISKDTAYFDNNGNVVCETLIRASKGELVDFTNTYIINVYPDVYAWMTDFANAKNEQYMKNYFTAPAFDNFPVVGVTWEQADAYCAWKTEMFKQWYPNAEGVESYRLPTEAEWSFAARNGLSESEYPWITDGASTKDGLALGNFRGSIDLKDLVTPVGTYMPNLFGLYDMAGNVAEWTSTAYSESVDLMSDVVNPDYSYRAVASDPDILKRKVVKGGSWKDTQTFARSDVRTFEYQNKGRSYIGFRCARSWGLDSDGYIVIE